MKKLNFIYLLLLTTMTTSVLAGPGEITSFSSTTMGVGIEDDGKKLVMVFEDNYEKKLHTVIDMNRIHDLEYKTRIMRYFGGMLKNDTYKFESILVLSGEESFEMEFNRENVSSIINSILTNYEA